MKRSISFGPQLPASAGTGPVTPTLHNSIFRRLADTSSQGIGMAGLDSRIIYCNQTLCRLLGIPDGALLADHSFYDFYSRQDSQRLREEIIPQVQSQGEWSGEIGLCSLTGEQYQTIQNIFLIRDDSGAPTAFANVITDITGHVKADAARRIKDAAIASSINAIAITGSDGNLTYVNQAFADLWRLPVPEAALGRSPLEFWETPQQAQLVIDALYTQGHWQGELRARLHDGALADLQLSAHIVMDASGIPLCMMASFMDITAHKQSEAEILATRMQLEATLNAIPGLLFEVGLDGTYYYVHAQSDEQLAAPADELLGKTIFDVLPPAASAIAMAALREAHEKGHSRGMQIELPLSQGSSWFELSISQKQTTPGQEPRFIVLSHEITARKRLEQALRHSSACLNDAQRIARIGSWELDLTTGELHCSDELFRIFEIDRRCTEVTYKTLLDTIHPDDREAVNKAYTDSLLTLTPYEISLRLLMSDGRIKWVQERCTSDFNIEGTPLRSRGTVQDISERILTEQALIESESLFRTLAQVAPVGIFRTDAAGSCSYVNEHYCEITGRSREAAFGDGWTNAIHPDDRATFFQAWMKAVQSRTPFMQECRLVRPDGRVIWIVNQARAEEDARGWLIGYVGTVTDITQRKEAEEEIRHLAFYDHLTGLANRRLLLDRLQQALAASTRTGHNGALLFIDLDNFKGINDALGHDKGDMLLQQVAQRLKVSVREVDTVARFGGDEFVVILEELSSDIEEAKRQTEAVAEKISSSITQPCQLGMHSYQTSPSIGITLFGDRNYSLGELLQQADMAMYQAKMAGRNTLQFFNRTAAPN